MVAVVTKDEQSNMQEIWQEVGESKSIYGRLWSFGVESLRFQKCSLYEVSDLLLGDHVWDFRHYRVDGCVDASK